MRFVEDEYDRIMREELEEEEEYMIVENIADFIEKRTEEDENGEPPDNDTIEEALELSVDYCWDDLIEKAYEAYYRRKK